MLKCLGVFFLTVFVSILLAKVVLADDNFNVDTTVTYEVQDTGKTLVTHEITLENVFSTLYATSYTIQLENVDVQNIKAYELDSKGEKVNLEVVETKDGDKVNAVLTFKETVVGKGSQRHFFVTYENASFVVRTGEVWEVSIPKLGDSSSFRNYQAVLKVPVSLGQEAYLSPTPTSSTIDSGNNTYTFDKNSLIKTGVTAGFGQFQVFTFTLNYHLENPLAIGTETSVAIPPDTSFQKIYIHTITPQPSNVIVDPDGNYIANFKLTPRQRVDVVVSGEVQIFSSQRPFPKPSERVLADNLKESTYWQVNDPQIKDLALKLKTPKEIYNFVTTSLKYNYERVAPNEQRMGALDALKNPDQAICMEFTDLFIAIARATGIPTREINGYAYTENPEIQPLSLVADVLHSWPEYYDKEKGAWIPIDPTWGSTTGGVDFFNKLDLRHFTFVIHGIDDTKPYAPGSYKLGVNPQKDVFVSFGKLSNQTTSFPEISASFKPSLPFFSSTISISVKNPGPTGFYGIYPTVYFDKDQAYRDFIEALPPFGHYQTSVKLPYSLLAQKTPEKIRIEVGGSELSIPTNKNRVIVDSLVTIFALFIIILVAIIIRMKWTKKFLKPFLLVREYIFSKLGKRQSI